MSKKEKKLKPVKGNPCIISRIDESRCYVNDCLDKFKPVAIPRTKVISTEYLLAGDIRFEIDYTEYTYQCECGKQYPFGSTRKDSKTSLFDRARELHDSIFLNKTRTLANDFEQLFSENGEPYYRLKT